MAVSDFLKEKSDDTVNTIKNRSLSYTPEWSFDTEQPDMGTALGLLFADMMGDTLKRFYRLPSKYQLQFYNLLGLEPLPPDEASGYVTFSPLLYLNRKFQRLADVIAESIDIIHTA